MTDQWTADVARASRWCVCVFVGGWVSGWMGWVGWVGGWWVGFVFVCVCVCVCEWLG